MIEKEILDRVPLYPGRIKLVPVKNRVNTFDMTREDNPSVVGTPINKATLDSIIQSRLTGRYYTPSMQQTTGATITDVLTNPIPSSGWVTNGNTEAVSGDYTVYVHTSASEIAGAFDGDLDTRWTGTSVSGVYSYFTIKFSQPIKMRKFKAKFFLPSGNTITMNVKGSNDGKVWTTLHTFNLNQDSGEKERTLTTTGNYQYYRWELATLGENFYIYSLALSLYDFITYINTYTLDSGVPSTWTEGQRIMIAIPEETATLGISKNTLNGVPINTILLAGKRYELRYTGTSFVAKEV
jgi:hypothetical protein